MLRQRGLANVAPAIVDLDHFGLGQPGVGHDETYPREQLTLMPLDLADHPARLVPALGLVTEISDPDLDAALGWPAYQVIFEVWGSCGPRPRSACATWPTT